MAVKNSITASDLEMINPLISSDGNTYKVSSALSALADMFEEENSRALDHDGDFGLGISVLLKTCAAALYRMNEVKSQEGKAKK